VNINFARNPQWLCCLIAACVVPAVCGCGAKSTRLGVEGRVTFDGTPIPEGKISFIPLAGTSSPTAGATIRDGEFAVPREKGLRPGKFRVEIRAVRASGKTIRDDLSGEMIAKRESYIPKRFNDASDLVAEIKPDEPNRLEFALNQQ
jgi:hypothetical protein